MHQEQYNRLCKCSKILTEYLLRHLGEGFTFTHLYKKLKSISEVESTTHMLSILDKLNKLEIISKYEVYKTETIKYYGILNKSEIIDSFIEFKQQEIMDKMKVMIDEINRLSKYKLEAD